MNTLAPCELHEMLNCSTCTGVDKRHAESLREVAWDRGSLPRISGGPTIWAQYHGTCLSCGRRWEPGDPIHRSEEYDGWIGVACCAAPQ